MCAHITQEVGLLDANSDVAGGLECKYCHRPIEVSTYYRNPQHELDICEYSIGYCYCGAIWYSDEFTPEPWNAPKERDESNLYRVR